MPSAELPDSRIRIPHRPAVSLVDLSSGGALIELPFQAQPWSRFTVELHTHGEQLVVPFQLLRCYVAELKDGVRYHAAGAFDRLLNFPGPMTDRGASPAVRRLIGTLEQLLRAGREADPTRSGDQFRELLASAIADLRRGESTDLVGLKIKSRLTRHYPSLAIYPSTPSYRDALTSAEFFGFTFKWRNTLSAHDRRFLKSSAQLIYMLDQCRREQDVESDMLREDRNPLADQPSPLVVYTAAEWLASKPQSQWAPSLRPIRVVPVPRIKAPRLVSPSRFFS